MCGVSRMGDVTSGCVVVCTIVMVARVLLTRDAVADDDTVP